MTIIQNLDSGSFRLNGKKHVKNYIVLPINDDAIAIYNAYDTRMQLLPATFVSEISVGGVIFPSQQLLIDELAPMLFAKQLVSLSGLEQDSLINIDLERIDNEIHIAGGGVWRLSGLLYSNVDEFVYVVPSASSGATRIDIIVAAANTFEVIQGTEDVENPTAPVVPNGTLLVTTVTVIGEQIVEEIPFTGDEFVRKMESNELSFFFIGALDTFNVPCYLGAVRFNGTCSHFASFNFFPVAGHSLYSGKKIIIKNFQAYPLTLKHNVGGGTFKFSFPNEEDFILKPNQIAEFSLSLVSNRLEYIGLIPTNDWDDLENVPTEFNPSAHTHEIDDVVGLQEALEELETTPQGLDSVLGVSATGNNKNVVFSGGSFGVIIGNTQFSIGSTGVQSNKYGITSNTQYGGNSSNVLTGGTSNTSFGTYTHHQATGGNNNTLVGFASGYNLSTGSNNIVVGYQNVNLGAGAGSGLTSGSNNIIISPLTYNGITTGSNNVVIGKASGLPTNSTNTIVLADGAGNIRLQVASNGLASLPSSSVSTISGNSKSIVTKEYIDLTVGETVSGHTAQIASAATVSNVWKKADGVSYANSHTEDIQRGGNITLTGANRSYSTQNGNANFGTSFGHITGGGGITGFIQMFSQGSNGGLVNPIIGSFTGATTSQPQMTFNAVKNSAYQKWDDSRLLFSFRNGYAPSEVDAPTVLGVGTDFIRLNSYPTTRTDTGSTSNYLATLSDGTIQSKPVSGLTAANSIAIATLSGNVTTNTSQISTVSLGLATLTSTVSNKIDKVSSPSAISGLWSGTQAQYDAITTKDPAVMYFIQ